MVQTLARFHLNSALISSSHDFLEGWGPEEAFDNPSVPDDAEDFLKKFIFAHELRHFHDCFGTMAGIDLFFHSLNVLDRFDALIMQLARDGTHIKTPIDDFSESNNLRNLGSFLHFARRTEAYRTLFLGIRGPSTVYTSIAPNAPFLELGDILTRHHYVSYPMSLLLHDSYAMIPVPIGVAALMEGTAHGLLRDYASELDPDQRRNFEARFMTFSSGTLLETSLEDYKSMAVYNASDYAVSRFFKSSVGNSSIGDVKTAQGTAWPRSILFTATDLALLYSSFSFEGDQLSFNSPGHAFRSIVESIDPRDRLEQPITPPDNENEIIHEMLASMTSSCPKVEELEYEHDVDVPPADVLSSFAIHSLIKPIFEARLETDNAIFRSSSFYRRNAGGLLPNVPFFQKGREPIKTFAWVPEIVQKKQHEALIRFNILEQLLAGEEYVKCPRAYRLIPGAEYEDWAVGMSCEENICENRCIPWKPGTNMRAPMCLFSLMLFFVFRERPWKNGL